MVGYSLTTFGTLVSALQARLGKQSINFYSQGELQFYIREALQTWQAFSQFYTLKAQIPTVSGTLFYNLSALIPQLAPSITDQDLITQIQIHLLEPTSSTSWIGTEQFTYQQVVDAIQKRIDQFKLETGLTLVVSEVVGPSPPAYSIDLDDTVIDVRRAMWKTIDGAYSLLWRADEYVFTAASPSWFNTAALPTDFSTTLQQPLGLVVSPQPNDIGLINLFTINSGPTLSPATSATILGIPDDFVWVVKFGTLADLFAAAGPGQDLARAGYCESRWSDGIELARITNFVKLGYQNGIPAFVDSMEELDTSSPGWVSGTPGPPLGMAVSGNIAATSPIADDVYSLMFDITPKMILPGSLSDFVQIGQEYLDVIVDYAQHLAHLKEGIAETLASFQLYKNFVTLAAVENDRLRAASNNFDVLSDRTQREEHVNLRRKSDLSLTELNYAPSK